MMFEFQMEFHRAYAFRYHSTLYSALFFNNYQAYLALAVHCYNSFYKFCLVLYAKEV